jgi:hypothetical protein
MNARFVVAALALTIGFGAIGGSAHAAQPAPLIVSSVLPPEPPGTEPGSLLSVQATVRARNAFGRSAQLTFYLATDPAPASDNVPIASVTVALIPALFGETVRATASIPQDVTPGFYYLLACAGNSCAATAGTLDVIGQALSAAEPPGGTALGAAPGTEYFPENPADGMTVGEPFDCPLSTHGQFPSNCVWVTSKKITVVRPDTAISLMYCPTSNPYPFQVAIGNDPLWQDLALYPSFAKTTGVSNTKYKADLFGAPLSYSGLDPSDSGKRGYATFSFLCGSNECLSTFTGQVKYLCTDRPTTSALP